MNEKYIFISSPPPPPQCHFLYAPCCCTQQQVHIFTIPRNTLLHTFTDFLDWDGSIWGGTSSTDGSRETSSTDGTSIIAAVADKDMLRHVNGRAFFNSDNANSASIALKLNPALSTLTFLCNLRSCVRTCFIFLRVCFLKAIKTNEGLSAFWCNLENKSRFFFFSSSRQSKKKKYSHNKYRCS